MGAYIFLVIDIAKKWKKTVILGEIASVAQIRYVLNISSKRQHRDLFSEKSAKKS